MAIFKSPTYYDCIQAVAERAVSFGSTPNIRTLVFCEDRLTLSIELAIAKFGGGTFSTEVISFGRYTRKNSPSAKSLSKEGSAMVVKRVLSNLNDLQALGGMKSSPALATSISELIAQLKSAKVTPEKLLGCIDDCPQNISAKIHDIAITFKGYEDFLKQNGLTDGNNSMNETPNIIDNDDAIKNTHVIIAGYSSITRQTCEIIESLYRNAKTCDFFAISGDNKDAYTSEFLDLVKRIDNSPILCTSSSACSEALAIANGIFNPKTYSKAGLYSDKVSIYEAKNQADEIDTIASRIRYEVIENGLRYRDIAIGVGSLKDYPLTLKSKLKDYGIPAFIDVKRNLSEHPVIRLFSDFIKLATNKSDVKAIKRIISNSSFLADKPIADKMIRTITANSVSGKTFFDLSLPLSEEDDLFISSVRSSIVNTIALIPTKSVVKDYTTALKELIDDLGIRQNLATLSIKLSQIGEDEEVSFNDQALGKIESILDEIEDILSQEIVSSEDFLRILSSGTDACEISLIPEYSDGVYVAELKDCRFRKYRILFTAGLTGEIPAVKADTALLPDGDIGKLNDLQVYVEPKIRVVNKREKEAVALALLSFSDKLCLSYSLMSPSGKQVSKSEIIDYIAHIFQVDEKPLKAYNSSTVEKDIINGDSDKKDKLQSLGYLALRPAFATFLSESDNFRNGASDDSDGISSFCKALNSYQGGKFRSLADNLIGKINNPVTTFADINAENYFNNRLVSASILETFFSCPYKSFAKNGLELADSLSSDVRALDFGNILHNVAENFIKRLSEVDSEEKCNELAGELYDEVMSDKKFARFMQSPDFAYSATLVKKEAIKFCNKLYIEFLNSDFKPVGEEVWFADWGEYKSFPLLDGKFKLFGKADRVDKYGNNVRIVDYKSGKVDEKIKDANFYAGIYLQLYLYMNGFAVNGDEPAGAYYYPVNDNFIKDGDEPYNMYGKTVIDSNIIDATDKRYFATGQTSSIHIKQKISKEGEVTYSGHVADSQTFKCYMKYAKLLAESGIKNIDNGFIIPSPYGDTCSYCEYKSMCRYDSETDNRTRRVAGISEKTIIQAVEGKR